MAWDNWLNEQLNQPDKADLYVIQLTYIVYGILSSLGGEGMDLEIEDLIIKFGRESTKDPEKDFYDGMTVDEYTAHAIASWGARTGMDPRQLKEAVEQALPPGQRRHGKYEVLPPEKDLRIASDDS